MALKTKSWHLLADPSIPYFEPGKSQRNLHTLTKGEGWRRLRIASEATRLLPRPVWERLRPLGLSFHWLPRVLPHPRGRRFPGALGTETLQPQHFGHLWLGPETAPSGAPGLRGCGGDPRRQFGSNEPLPPARVGAGGSRPRLSLRSGSRREDSPQGFARPCAVALDGRGGGARWSARLVNQSTQAAER